MGEVVYDSERGRTDRCPTCGRRADRCHCGELPARAKRAAAPVAASLPRDGVLRVLRDRKGRGGKVVTVIAGLPGSAADQARLAAELKRLCGSGGTVKAGLLEIQGDHRDRVAEALRARGFPVKLAGG